MQKNTSTFQRFLSLLFTDKDISEDTKEERGIMPKDIASKKKEILDDQVTGGVDHQMEAKSPINDTLSAKEVRVTIAPTEQGPDSEVVNTYTIQPNKKIYNPPTPSVEEKIPEKKKIIPQKNTALPIESQEDSLLLGTTPDQLNTVNIDIDALKRHMLIVGMTGSGKTSMMEQMILQDIEAGRGVGLIDPHGDLYEKIKSQIPKSRSNDVILFDLTDVEYPIGFNILENTHEQFPSLIASSIVGVFKKIFGYSWGPRLEYILRNATLTLLEKEGATLLDLALLLSDEDFRRAYIGKISNPYLKRFWDDEFNNLSSTKQSEVVSPILNKVGQFLSVPLIRNIISQPQSGFFTSMDHG